jgi:hypothetical protein
MHCVCTIGAPTHLDRGSGAGCVLLGAVGDGQQASGLQLNCLLHGLSKVEAQTGSALNSYASSKKH